MRNVTLIVTGLLTVASSVAAEPPLISNAEIESRTLEGTLADVVEKWVESVGTHGWLGWEVPMVEGDEVLCCRQRAGRRWQAETCALEGPRRQFIYSSDRPPSFMKSDTLVVLLRAAEGQLRQLRAYSGSCELDAGASQIRWLEAVAPAESVDFLAGLAESGSTLQEEALMALALHATSRASERLATLARRSSDADLRGEALFWLAQTGAANATGTLLRAVEEDPDREVRKDAVFALSLLPPNQGTELLLQIIRDRSRPSAIREHAFFWYVQAGDEQALDLIAEILRN